MTCAGRTETRPNKAGTLLRKDKERSEQRRPAGANDGDRQLTGARASAAARSRGHSAWGKRHIPKAARAGFSASPVSKNPGVLVQLSNVTKVTTSPCMLRFFCGFFACASGSVRRERFVCISSGTRLAEQCSLQCGRKIRALKQCLLSCN